MATPISMLSAANQAAIEYSRVKIERKEMSKRTAQAEKTRIEEWQQGLETASKSSPLPVTSSSQDKPLPTQKPLPPLPADKTHSKRKKIARFFGLHKKKNEDEEDEEDGIDFSDVFDNPIYRPGELKEDGHEPLTALPHMSDPNQPRASGETGATGRETVEEKKWTLRKMASRRFYEE